MRKHITNAALVSAVVLSFTLVVSGQVGARPAAVVTCITPTVTPTAIATVTPTATPGNSPTASPTATPTNTPTNTPTAGPTNTPTAGPGPSRRVAVVDPCVTPTATPTPTTGSGSGAGGTTSTTSTTIARGGIPATGSNPSPLAPLGLAAVLLGVALLVVVSVRRTKPSQPA